MYPIENEFDDISHVSEVKDFDQSKQKPVDILSVPQAYQMFDELSGKVTDDEHSLSEVTLFATKLDTAKSVRKNDVLALESIIGQLSELPGINTYTQDYSLVNYTVTQETVLSTLVDFTKKVANSIWQFIMKVIDFLRNHSKKMFAKEVYVSNPTRQKDVEKNAKATKEDLRTGATQNVKNTQRDNPTPSATNTAPVSPVSEDDDRTVDKVAQAREKAEIAREVRLNREIRKVVYPHFNNLSTLSGGETINHKLLIEEMCEQRFKPFYTALMKAIYEKDDELMLLTRLYKRNVDGGIEGLMTRTDELLNSNLAEAPVAIHARKFTLAPEQLNEFVKRHSSGAVTSDRIKVKDDQYKVLSGVVYDTLKEMTSIKTTYELPEPCALINIDFNWLSDLLIATNIEDACDVVDKYFSRVTKAYGRMKNHMSEVHPITRLALNDLYSDWIIINRMFITAMLLRARIEALYKNIATTLEYTRKVSALFTAK